MKTIIFSIILVIIAGTLNGSFAVPAQYILTIKKEKIWYSFSWWAFLIVPLITFFLMEHNFFYLLSRIGCKQIFILLLSGIFWGIGLVCMTIAFKYIGIGVVYVINIGIGTAGGTLLPLFFLHPGRLHTPFGVLVIVGVLLFLAGVVSAGIAAKIRDKFNNDKNNNPLIGIILSIITGVSSAFQGFSFAYGTAFFLKTGNFNNYNSLVVATIPWLLIFIGGFIPFMLYFLLIRVRKNYSTGKTEKISIKNYLIVITMAILFFESVIFYSKATLMLGALGPVIAWPIFMAFIVMASNFWSFKSGEWKNSNILSKAIMMFAICVQLLAVVVFAYAAQ